MYFEAYIGIHTATVFNDGINIKADSQDVHISFKIKLKQIHKLLLGIKSKPPKVKYSATSFFYNHSVYQ